jgi:hypothetical protein
MLAVQMTVFGFGILEQEEMGNLLAVIDWAVCSIVEIAERSLRASRSLALVDCGSEWH